MVELVEKKNGAEIAAAAFGQMQDRILHNKNEPFGGAFVLTPPGDDPVIVQSLALNDASPGLFWATIKTIVQQQIDQVDELERRTGQGGFGRR